MIVCTGGTVIDNYRGHFHGFIGEMVLGLIQVLFLVWIDFEAVNLRTRAHLRLRLSC